MRKIGVVLGMVSLVVLSFSVGAQAGDADKKEDKMVSGPTTVEGEVVDLGCYLSHGATGEKHKSCALKCIAGGMPMGLLTEEGTLYLLTLSHDDADPFNAVKELAAENVKITGPVHERDGMLSLEVTSYENGKS